MYYGLTNTLNLLSCIKIACETVNPANVPVSIIYLQEISAVESAMGTALDTLHKEGRGWAQFDTPGFNRVAHRLPEKQPHIVEAIEQRLGKPWEFYTFEMLDMSPLLSAMWCRSLIYLIPEKIPTSRAGRAHQWKQWYNSHHPSAKGTPEKYIAKAESFNLPEY